MNTQLPKSLQGASLVEILVSLVVVAVGVLALYTMHGNLITSVATDEARAEAMELAQASLEEFTSLAVESQYSAAALDDTINAFVNDTGNPISGQNATFTRQWMITDSTDLPMKEVVVRVFWTASDGTVESVNLVSNMTWKDPLIVGSLATDGIGVGGVVPAPGGDVARPGADPDDPGTGTPTLWVTEDDSDKFYRRDYLVLPEGVVGVGESRTAIENEAGEVLMTIYTTPITIEGRVWHPPSVSTVAVVISDTGFCAWPMNTGSVEVTNPDATKATLTSGEYKCITGTGWRGKVGLGFFDPALLEDKGQIPVTCPGIARYYVHYVVDDSDPERPVVTGHEGISTSYALSDNHNFASKKLEGNESCETLQASLEAALGETNLIADRIIVENAAEIPAAGVVSGLIQTEGQAQASFVSIAVQGPATGACEVIIGRKDTELYTCTLWSLGTTAEPDSNKVTFAVSTGQDGATISPESFTYDFDTGGDGPDILADRQ